MEHKGQNPERESFSKPSTVCCLWSTCENLLSRWVLRDLLWGRWNCLGPFSFFVDAGSKGSHFTVSWSSIHSAAVVFRRFRLWIFSSLSLPLFYSWRSILLQCPLTLMSRHSLPSVAPSVAQVCVLFASKSLSRWLSNKILGPGVHCFWPWVRLGYYSVSRKENNLTKKLVRNSRALFLHFFFLSKHDPSMFLPFCPTVHFGIT